MAECWSEHRAARSKTCITWLSRSVRTAATGMAALAFAAVPALADVKAGVDAWSAGDFSRAVAEWQGPAQSGDADALFNLAQAYRLGRGVEQDVTRAKELYAEAARKGHAKAADNYGLLLFQLGEQRDAMPFIRAASDRGDPRAQYIMGLAHFNTDYAEKDWVRAYALITLAQSAGLPQAKNALSEMDRYVPIKHRQLAQNLAREIESEASARRAAELASLDLTTRPAMNARAVNAAPTQVAAARPSASRETEGPPRAVPRDGVQNRSQENPAPRAAPPASEWKVQLGAFGVSGNAERLWSRLSGDPALSGTSKVLLSSGNLTRLLAAGFASQAEARSACAKLKQQGHGCLVTRG